MAIISISGRSNRLFKLRQEVSASFTKYFSSAITYSFSLLAKENESKGRSISSMRLRHSYLLIHQDNILVLAISGTIATQNDFVAVSVM